MATSTVIYPHAIDLDGGTNVITQLNDVTPGSNQQDAIEYSAGEAAPQFAYSSFATPDINFTTPQMKRLLDVIDGPSGAEHVAANLSAGDVDLYYKKGTKYGTRDALTSNYRGRLTQNSMVYMQSIRATQGNVAEIVARLLPTWDGTNQPLIWTADQALGMPAPTVEHVYTLGPVSIGGTALEAVQEVDIQYNVEPEEVGDGGSPYITYAAISRFNPVITIRTRNDDLSALDMDGQDAANTVIYFRKRILGGINEGDAATEHIQLTAAAAVKKWRTVSGDNSMIELLIQTYKSTPTAIPLEITGTAVAIT